MRRDDILQKLKKRLRATHTSGRTEPTEPRSAASSTSPVGGDPVEEAGMGSSPQRRSCERERERERAERGGTSTEKIERERVKTGGGRAEAGRPMDSAAGRPSTAGSVLLLGGAGRTPWPAAVARVSSSPRTAAGPAGLRGSSGRALRRRERREEWFGGEKRAEG